MLPKDCGLLLYNAVRETLETMAFAEVVPCSIRVGGQEISQEDGFSNIGSAFVPPVVSDDGGWGDVPAPSSADPWGTALPEKIPEEDSWGVSSDIEPLPLNDGDEEPEWGKSGLIMPSSDPWGESSAALEHPEELIAGIAPKAADFNELVKNETDWLWARMKVNSPDIQSVYFAVTKSLADSLARNMYAGETFDIDSPLIRDLIAELTNVLGGKLMLLLEERGGKFTLTVPEIGIGIPEIPDLPGSESKNAYCNVIVDGEFPVISALCG